MNTMKALAVSALAIAGAGMASRASANMTAAAVLLTTQQQPDISSARRPDLETNLKTVEFTKPMTEELAKATGIADGKFGLRDHPQNTDVLMTFGNKDNFYYIDYGPEKPRQGQNVPAWTTVTNVTIEGIKAGQPAVDAFMKGLKKGWIDPQKAFFKADADGNRTYYGFNAEGKFGKAPTGPAVGGGLRM